MAGYPTAGFAALLKAVGLRYCEEGGAEGRTGKGGEGGGEEDGPGCCTGRNASGRSVGDHKTAASAGLDTFTVSAALTFWRTESTVESWCSQILNTRHPSRFN